MRYFYMILAFLLWPFSGANAFENGTMLFVENGHNLVECYTRSNVSHVAIVIDDQVYEAEPPVVHKESVEDWLTKIAKYNERRGTPAIVEVLKPSKPYTKSEIDKMRQFLDQQVGRRYSVRGYVRKIPGDGIHCAEMSAQALAATGRINVDQAYRLSPGNLREIVEDNHNSISKWHVTVKPEYRRSTMTKFVDWFKQKGRTCQWSCGETMRFYW